MAEPTAKPTVPTAKRDRSPAYPFISLKSAIKRTAEFELYFTRHPAPMDKVGLAWNMKQASSQAAQTMSALKYFGLIKYDGPDNQRVVVLTDDARNYLRAQQDHIKEEIAKRLALRPKALGLYWAKWGADRPKDPVALDELVLQGGFVESAARTFLQVYDETIAFAKLAADDRASGGDEDDDDEITVGDMIQWRSAGVDQFETPKRVRAIQDADGITWLFVDGSTTGLPMTEAILAQKGSALAKLPAGVPPILPLDPESKEREWLRGPLSKETSYRIVVSGDLGPKEIGKLIRVLEAQREVLQDDEET